MLDVFLRRLVGVPAFRCDFCNLLVRSAFGTNPNGPLIGWPPDLARLAAGRWGIIGVAAVSLGMGFNCARAIVFLSAQLLACSYRAAGLAVAASVANSQS